MEDKSQVKVKFVTNEEQELQVGETPLYVPVSLKRFGLSEVVNHLLKRDGETDDSKAIPFEFLIDGQLVRGSLQDYLTKKGLSSEAFLTLEYTRAVLPPSFLASFDNDDWISSVNTINSSSKSVVTSNLSLYQPKILSGSYDGIVRTYNMSGEVEKQYVGHSGPIKTVKWISPTRIVTGGNDRQLRLWKTSAEDSNDEETEEGKTLAILEGHKAAVSSVDVEYATNRILSGGQDNVVGFWSTNYKEMNSVESSDSNITSTASKKRKKMATRDASVRRRAPLAILESHNSPVEGVIFDATDSTVGYSASQDHTIKSWDLVTGRCVDTRTTGYSLLSILQLPQVNLIATGSSARHINLHDPRVTTSTHTNAKLVGHTNFVVSLAQSPNNPHMLSSASHDGTVKVWDVRSEKPMYTITRQEKSPVFGVDWDKDIGIVSGGRDKKIQINKGSDISK